MVESWMTARILVPYSSKAPKWKTIWASLVSASEGGCQPVGLRCGFRVGSRVCMRDS